MTTLTRKAFLGDLAGGAALLVLGGCGGGGGYGGSTTLLPAAGTCLAQIAGNHGHALIIPRADLDATTDKTYSIQGSADHSHDVTFTAAQLADLKAGRTVAVLSTITMAHQHGIAELCA